MKIWINYPSNNFVVSRNSCIFALAKMRKVGRVIECAGLEIRYTLSGYRGFESLTFRLEDKRKPD